MISSLPHPPSFLLRRKWFWADSPVAFNVKYQLIPKRQHFRVSCMPESSSGRKASSQFTSQIGNPSLESPLETKTWSFEVGSSSIPANIIAAPRLSFSSRALLLLCCMASLAFTGLVVAAVPTLFAMRRAAISLSKLADTAHEEIPSTMATLRLSGMEISDLTLELSDLSQEITDSVAKSAQAVEAAEAGIKQIGLLARQKTMSMIQERASLSTISLRPIVAGAAKKTSHAVSLATRALLNFVSRSHQNSVEEDGKSSADR